MYRGAVAAFLGSIALCLGGGSEAAVSEAIVSDVTTRAFSIIWVSDEPVTDARLRIFRDPDATDEITSALESRLVSADFSPALLYGVVKIDVVGLEPATIYYIQTETDGGSGTVSFPASPPLLDLVVQTASETTRIGAQGDLIANDLILHEAFVPGGIMGAGSLLVARIPSVAPYPISAFAGEHGVPLPQVLLDLNNVFDETGVTAEVTQNAILELSLYRGLACSDPSEQRLFQFRRAPPDEEAPEVSSAEPGTACFAADTVCDGEIDILDAQRVLNRLNETETGCAFNPDLDLVEDGVINILDVQSVLNHLGESAPFP